MNCSEIEPAIIDASQGRTPEELPAAASEHIAVCANCQAFLALQLELDAELSRAFSPPLLPPGFRDAIMRRVAKEPGQADVAEIAAKKRKYEEEYADFLSGAKVWKLLNSPGIRSLLLKSALAWTAVAFFVEALRSHAESLQPALAGNGPPVAILGWACVAVIVLACAGQAEVCADLRNE